MKRTKTLLIPRSNDYTGGGGGFGFTLRHFVVYPPSFSVNDVLQGSYSVVIDEHQQKQLEEVRSAAAASTKILSSSSPTTLRRHQGDEQGFSSANSRHILRSDHRDDNGHSPRESLRAADTILVKEVRSDSPAYRAGLRQGDRLLAVNQQAVHGKSYAQVIALIQNSPTDLILHLVPHEDDISSLTASSSPSPPPQRAPVPSPRSSSLRSPMPTMANQKTIEHKLRNLQLNLAQGRTEEALAQAGIYFPPSTSSTASSSNVFSNYIDSVHKALDSSSKSPPSSYHNDYIPYDYPPPSSFLPLVSRPYEPSESSREEELKSPSTDSAATEKDMKTEFVNFRKKQFESGHVENVVRDPQRESKTKKYSEKKKYENEWNRLTAVADVESVMERASHFEDVDPDKYARLRSKLPASPPPHQETLHFHEDLPQTFHANQLNYESPTAFALSRAEEINDLHFHYDPRYLLQPQRTPAASAHYAPLATNERFALEHYGTPPPPAVNLIRQNSYISAVRAAHPNDQGQFVARHDFPFNPETPVLRRKGNPYGLTPEQEMKQRRTSYLIATDQRMPNRGGGYLPSDYLRTEKDPPNYPFDIPQQQKLRHATPQHQPQAIRKLKNFFGEGTPEVTHALDHRSSLSPLPSSGGPRSKSHSYFEGSTARQSIPLTTLTDNIEPSKEGILYCKTVLKEGRRAADRSWRGAWAVLRRGALFLGKEKKHGLLIPLSCDSFPINLQDAEVELASDYIKKPRVFKLTTPNQSEFLFQAPDMQSLAEWLEVLNEHCASSPGEEERSKKADLAQRKSTSSLPQESEEGRKLSPTKGKAAQRSPSLKRSPSLRFRKSQKSSITQPTQAVASLTSMSSPSNVSPRRSFVKSIVKKGLRTLKSSSALLTNPMSGQIYDETSGESLSSATGSAPLSQGMNFGIELEECEASSFSRAIPIVVEILTRLVELRGINYQGIYRNAGGISAVNWLVNELDKGSERIELNSEKWYDVKAVASTLKTFFAKLPDSLLSSKMSSLCVEASRIENHCDRLVELKRLVVQLDDYRFETLKYLCAHFRRVASRCDVNKIDARNLAIIFGPTLIWDSKASLQSNLVDNPEKIRVIESFILYYEWFFEQAKYDSIPAEINPQMPVLPPVLDSDTSLSNEIKPAEIIQQIVRAAKRRWSSPLLLDSLSSLSTNTDQQQSKPINISVKRTRRRESKVEENGSRSRSVDSSLHDKGEPAGSAVVTSSTDSAVYSMSDISSSLSTSLKKPSQSLKDISHFFHYFTLAGDKHKCKTLTNLRRKKQRKQLTHETFAEPPPLAPLSPADGEELYERISNSSIGFIDQSPVHQIDFGEQTSLLKSKLTEHEHLLRALKQQITQVDEQLLTIHQEATVAEDRPSASRQHLQRRHTLNSFGEICSSHADRDRTSSSSSLYALQLL